MTRFAILSVLLFGACSSSGEVRLVSARHENFANRRPVTLALRVEGGSRTLAGILYRDLLEKGYSVLAPGVPVGTEAGVFHVEVTTRSAPWDARARFEDPTGAKIYEMIVEGLDGDSQDLADALLLDLPPK